ncbi:MAG TPA: LysR substrate-binding domain-containing protein, partial [Ramlibacter sp.]|nr:LysR substrate-binding domain-containing protein [Ramlibacter sp.]
MRFDWTDLQLFVHACEAGSLTAAATRSHITLAAASARLRGMEQQAGTALLVRHSRGVRATPAGEALARHAQAVLLQLAQMRGELAHHGRGARGRIRLLSNTSALLHDLPPVLSIYLKDHPAIDVQVDESASHLTTQALRQGAADLGLVSDAADTSGLHAVPLRDDPLVLVLPRGHALLALRRVAFSDALDHDMVGYGTTSALQAHLSLQSANIGKPMRLRASLGSFEGLLQLVAQRVGMAVMPRALLFSRGPDARLAVRPLTDTWARRTLLLCSSPTLKTARPAQRLHALMLSS